MITAETVTYALNGTETRYHSGTGWFSNGHFAIRGEQWVALATELREKVAAGIDELRRKKTVPVTEAIDLRIPRITGSDRCFCDHGTVTHDDCDDCNGHSCTECNGSGRREITKDVGQAVFVADGKETVVKPQYAALLEGLAVARDADSDPRSATLFGYDEAGELCAIVMPYFEKVRRHGVRT